MNDNTKLEIAVEIMSAKIASLIHKGVSPESNEMKEILKEKNEMYRFNQEVINKIINVYGKELKQ